jgi:hypothetical protein
MKPWMWAAYQVLRLGAWANEKFDRRTEEQKKADRKAAKIERASRVNAQWVWLLKLPFRLASAMWRRGAFGKIILVSLAAILVEMFLTAWMNR